jgi:FtsH-binding integral membrane protein
MAITAVVLSCCLVCIRPLARTVPINYGLLFAFTFCEAYVVAYSCAAVDDPMIILTAAFMTAGMVVGLTVYAFLAKTDFTTFGGVLFVLGAAFCMFGLFSFLFGSTTRLIYCLLGVILFGVYLVMDT